MAKENINEKAAARNENIQQTVSKTDKFFTENKKTIWGVVIAAIVIIAAAVAFSKFIYQPKCEEAMQQAYPAEQSFQQGNYDIALNGDGNTLGFAQIIEDYGTKAGKSMYLYAGICELQLGNYTEALDYLKKYKGKDSILSARAEACKGDAYVGLEDYDAAVKCFAAAAKTENVFAATYLLKEGVTLEKIGDKAAALNCYKTIKDKYPQSFEAYEIDKYINRVGE
mgnify:CR=1 FL=1